MNYSKNDLFLQAFFQKALGGNRFDEAFWPAAENGRTDALKWLKEQCDGATDLVSMLLAAACGGQISAMELKNDLFLQAFFQKALGANDDDGALIWAARGGHLIAMELAKEWGATQFDSALQNAARQGHIAAMKLLKE